MEPPNEIHFLESTGNAEYTKPHLRLSILSALVRYSLSFPQAH